MSAYTIPIEDEVVRPFWFCSSSSSSVVGAVVLVVVYKTQLLAMPSFLLTCVWKTTVTKSSPWPGKQDD